MLDNGWQVPFPIYVPLRKELASDTVEVRLGSDSQKGTRRGDNCDVWHAQTWPDESLMRATNPSGICRVVSPCLVRCY